MKSTAPAPMVFNARIEILGINPFVFVPEKYLRALFQVAGRQRGPIPLRVTLAEVQFRQNLVKSHGAWRLYLNTPMRAALGKDVGDRVAVQIAFDLRPRKEPPNPALSLALAQSPKAKAAFDALAPSRRKEITRYLNTLKSDAARSRNLEKVLGWLLDPNVDDAPAYLRATSRAAS